MRDWHIGCVLAFQASQASSILASRSKIMTLEDIKKLKNPDLLELYSDFVRVNHYDPYETPEFAKKLFENNVTLGDIAGIILERMK